MGYNLVIDQGNSTAKVAVYPAGDTVAAEEWRFDTITPEAVREITERYDIDAAIYCSVTFHGENIMATLRQDVKRLYELTSFLPLPVAIDYANPSLLGRDRIAAVAGAYAAHPGRCILVVDAGTAVTYDVLTPDGHFLGGNIAPGLWLRAESLHSHTSRLPMVDVESSGDSEPRLWGNTTESAIESGVVRGVAAEIAYYRAHLGDDTLVMLTGGDAMRIAPLVEPPLEVVPDLVRNGLNSILQYNELYKQDTAGSCCGRSSMQHPG